MNLIEKLGLEKCKAIVDGAPTRTSHINIWGDCIYVESKHQMYVFSVELGWTHYHQREEIFSLDMVRTAIANHERTDDCTDIKNHIQARLDQMKDELNNMEQCYIQIKQEYNELIAFNTVLDRKQKAAEKIAEKYKFKVSMITDLLRDCSDQDMTLKAITTVIERVGE